MFFILVACTPPEFVTTQVWSGFHYEWEELSHRLSLVQATLNDDGSMDMGMIGGDWSTGELFSDLPQFRMHQQEISDSGFRAVHGKSTLTLFSDQKSTVELPLAENKTQLILRGFSINTDIAQSADYPLDYNPAHGYTASGFEVAGEADSEKGIAYLHAQVDWGPQDRESMNAAMLEATTELTVYWSQIEHTKEAVSHNIALESTHDYDPPFSEHAPMQSTLELDTPSVIGISRFSLSLQDQEGTDMGSYWRRMGVEISPASNLSYDVVLDASNSSLIEELAVQAYGEVDLISFPLAHNDSQSNTLSYSDQHEVGTHSYEHP